MVRFVSNITKEYPNMYKVLIYKSPAPFLVNEGFSKRHRDLVDEATYEPEVSSLNRTKTTVKDIVLCNDFDLFCTFTFDPKKGTNVYNLMSCWHKIDRFLSHQRDRSNSSGKELKYLIIPEQHKSGAWHFHALLSGFNGVLRDSHHFTASGRPIYNITSYRAGFSTATPIDNKDVVASYITKYITKDFVKSFNQRRFFCSRNLTRPVKTVNSDIFSKTLPLFRRRVADLGDRELYEIDSLSL